MRMMARLPECVKKVVLAYRYDVLVFFAFFHSQSFIHYENHINQQLRIEGGAGERLTVVSERGDSVIHSGDSVSIENTA